MTQETTIDEAARGCLKRLVLGALIALAATASQACTTATTTPTETNDQRIAETNEPSPISDFAKDDDGWTIIGDANEATPKWYPDGGNPGALICAKDDAVGGVWYYKAPPKFLGDRTSSYGKDLSFDLKVTKITSPFDNVDVSIKGSNGTKLVFDTSPAPEKTWTHFTMKLTEASGWKKQNLRGEPPTEAEFRAVLADIQELLIRGEFNTGDDTGCLDNPQF